MIRSLFIVLLFGLSGCASLDRTLLSSIDFRDQNTNKVPFTFHGQKTVIYGDKQMTTWLEDYLELNGYCVENYEIHDKREASMGYKKYQKVIEGTAYRECP